MSHKIYFTPGPSQLYHTVPYHIQNALKDDVMSISHRSNDFKAIVKESVETLRELLDIPKDYKVLFLSSANEAWERIIQNLVVTSSHHFVNGAFSDKFFKFTSQYHLNSTSNVTSDGHEFDSYEIPERCELISVTINETSIGYAFDIGYLKQLRKEHPDKLISADLVSAIPGIEFDFKLVDIGYFSVQKCFGLPAGLGVWILSPNAIEKFNAKKNTKKITGSYHSLSSLLKQIENFQTPETPNMLNIYLVGKVSQDFIRRGTQIIQSETKYKSALLYTAFEKHEFLKPFISNRINRSKTVCVADLQDNSGILEFYRKKGMILGDGYGQHKGKHIRVANFPAHSKENIEMLVDLLESY